MVILAMLISASTIATAQKLGGVGGPQNSCQRKNVQNKTKHLKLMKRACQMCSVVINAFRIEKGIEINKKCALEYLPPMRRI